MNEIITIKNDLGEEKKFDVLFSFISKNNGKKYVTYTNYEKDYKGNIMCYSGFYEGDKLLPIDTEKEVIIAKRAERSSFGGTGIYNGESAVVSKYFRSRAKQKAARIDRHGDIKEALEAEKRNAPIKDNSDRSM